MKKIFLFIGAIFLAMSIFSQSQQSFKYQAIARDEAGNILSNENINLRISLMQNSAYGPIVYQEEHVTRTNSFGLINLNIGSGNIVHSALSVVDFRDIAWDLATYYIKIELKKDKNDEYIEMGTSRLLAVPYAMYAYKSGSEGSRAGEWTNDGTDIFSDETSFPGSNLGIGTTGPGGKLHIYGTGLSGPIAPMLFVQHQVGFSSTFRRNINSPGNALFLLQKSRGSLTSPSIVENGDNIGQIRMEGYDGTEYQTAGWVRVIVDGTPATDVMPGALLFATTDNTGSVLERMRITSSGKVGIGFTDPTDALEVNGVITATGGNSGEWNTAYSWGDHSAQGYLTSFTEVDPTIGSITQNYLSKWDGSQLISSSVYDNGNIGIGITNANQKLSVSGNIQSTNGFYPGNGTFQSSQYFGHNGTYLTASNLLMQGVIQMNNQSIENVSHIKSSTDAALMLQGMGSGEIRFNENNSGTGSLKWYGGGATPLVTFTTNGNIGIGTLAPSEPLEVVGNIVADTISADAFSSNSPLLLQTNGTTRIFADDVSGNVGVGTTDPSEDFEVNGTGKMNNLILKDANGANWELFVDLSGTLQLAFYFTQCGDSLYDYRDGKYYQTVEIGSQCWFAENLNVGKRIDISEYSSDNDTIEKYCYSDSEDSCNIYGGLYLWDEMMDYVTTNGAQGICPDGWHVPTDSEWCTLEDYVDAGSITCTNEGWRGTDMGGNLKETGLTHWTSPNNATNSSGFTALPGGYLYDDGISTRAYLSINDNGIHWTSTEGTFSTEAWERHYRYNFTTGYRTEYQKIYGLTVRCLKD